MSLFRPHFFSNTTFVVIFALLVAGVLTAYLKLEFLGITHSSDYDTYVLTAQYVAGEVRAVPGDISIPQRLLKPAYPLYLALAEPYLGFFGAALFQSVVFYLLLIIALYLLAKEFLEDEVLPVLFVALTAFSYPVLKYGLDVYSETGAWFMYALSLWLTLKFVKRPSPYLFMANVALITLGFLWKEYIIVAGMVFGLALLFHGALSAREKAAHIGAYAALFLAVHVPWQLYVFRTFEFSYLDWYVRGGADGFSYEFTLKNIVKSTAALLGLAWLIVPHGFVRVRSTSAAERLFAYASVFPPLIGYAWGFISSRLLYVIAPPMTLIALLGMKGWTRQSQVMFVALASLANIGWLFLSYRIIL
jgi:hypothetical protein